MKRFTRNWGAVAIILLLFVGSWVGQFLTQFWEFTSDAQTHGESGELAEFMPEFWAATFENWQSEFLQLAVQAILIASFVGNSIFKADHGADKDDVERIINEYRRHHGSN